jgi:P-type Cu+ transporter
MIKKKFKISGMHCTSCAMNIDGELEDTEGVKSASTNFAKGVVEVEYDSEKLDDKKIISAIKTAGYSAEIATS